MDQDHTREISTRRAEHTLPLPERCCPKCGLVVPDATLVCPQDGTSLLEKPGTILSDRYEFLSETGRGGMSVIYRARHLSSGKVVAIKMLQAVSVTEESLKRFYQEVKAISSLHHPNIISVHDFGVSDSGQPYMVMDFIEGKNLGDVIKEKGALSLEESLHRFIQLCDALGHAHDVGVLHRDLKPGNIMLSSAAGNFEDARLVDFGIAKLLDQEGEDVGRLTQTGQLFGSPLYMSPEQCRAARVDARTDIYSMGCVMYETLTGIPPLQGSTIVDTIVMQMHDTPKPLSEACPERRFSQALENIIAKTLAKDPAERFQTMQELEMALMQVRPDVRVTGDQPGRAKVRDRRLSVPNWVYGSFACFILGASGLAGWWAGRSAPPMDNQISSNDLHSDAEIVRYRKELLQTMDRKRLDNAVLADCLRTDLGLSELNLDEATLVDDAGAAHIAVLTSLRVLKMVDTKVGDPTLEKLVHLPLLQYIDLRRTRVSDDGMMHLLAHKDVLKELYVPDTQVTDNGLTRIGRMKALRSLSIGYLPAITDSGVMVLKDLALEKLFLTTTNISDKGLAVLDNMTSMQELYLQDTKVTDQGLKHLERLNGLKWLYISRTQLTGKALRYLTKLKALTRIYAGETDISDDGMVYLQKLPALKELRLNNTKITDRALFQLNHIESLCELNLANTVVSDAGLKALEAMPMLGVLDLEGTNITDKGLEELRKYQQLTSLNLSNCRGVTSDAVQRLRNDRPKWYIKFETPFW